MTSDTQRRALLTAALGFRRLNLHAPAARALARWMDSWRGVGALVVGMTAQGFNAELKQFPYGWRANFYPAGMPQSIVVGSAYEAMAWCAVQRAAWDALHRPPQSS